jgi:hypothetical protein
MQRLAHEGLKIAFHALGAFVLVLILLGLTAGVAIAQTASPAAPDTPIQVPGQAPTPTITPPAEISITIRQDTPEEREAFLKQRAISQSMRIVSEVPSLPQQRITPPASRQP